MSNYHVEPVDRPKALAPQALKSLRRSQVQGISRRQLLRYSLGGAVGLWLLEVTAGTIGFIWPNLTGGFGSKVRIGTLEDLKLANSNLPISDGFPAYVPDARAYIVLIDTGQQRFLPGDDPNGDGTALNVRGLYQRCPHLGCRPNPCLKNFWMECPCHGSRYDRLGIKAAGPQYGPAPRGMDRFSLSVDGSGVLTLDTGKITLGPLPVAVGLAKVDWPVELDARTRSHLLHLYGSRAGDVVRPALDDPSLLEPLVPGRPDLRAQELYAREHELAMRDEDVVRRRTTVWLRPESSLGSGHVSEADAAPPAARS